MDNLIIVISLILSGFFSGMEIAYISVNKVYVEIQKTNNDFLARLFVKLTKEPSKFITTMLTGNSISLVVFGFFMGKLIVRVYFPDYQNSDSLPFDIIFIQTLISTLVVLVTAEFLPKVIFKLFSDKLLKFFSLPAYFFYLFFYPVTYIITAALSLILKTSSDNKTPILTKKDLGYFISEQIENADYQKNEIETEIQIFQNALGFAEVKAREVMVPRAEIIAVEENETTERLKELFIETGFSKILIYRNSIDDIIGCVTLFDLFKNQAPIKKMLNKVIFVPETIYVKNVLTKLTTTKNKVAIVLDEYGGTSGMITIEDVIEELFGEIKDEHDSENLLEEKISKNSYNFSARLEIDYINENYRLNLPKSENYETLGGLIVNLNEDIPDKNEVVKTDNYEFIIKKIANTKIEEVNLIVL